MTTEFYWLTLSILLTAVLWIPYIINRIVERGFMEALWDPDGDTSTQVGWAKRLMDAHHNAVENLVVFAPLVLMLHMLNIHTPLTEFACVLYFFSRLAHVLLFTLRTPVLRTVSFLLGTFPAEMLLVLTLLGWIA